MDEGNFGDSINWSGGTPLFDGSDTLIFDLSQGNFSGQAVSVAVNAPVNG
jgi:hypothetical protein